MFNLMHHTAGFDDLTNRDFYDFQLVPINVIVPSLEDILRDISKTGLAAQNSQPGERVKYSNYGAALAGYVIEQISGVAFFEYVHSNIFAPLGMSHTALLPDLSDNEWVKSQRAKIKAYGGGDNELDVQRLQIGLYPAGAATGITSDMVRFAKAILPDENGVSVLFEESETLFKLFPSLEDIQNAVTDIRLVGIAYQYGFYIFPIRGELGSVIGHTGSTEGSVSILMIDIDRGIGVTFSENTHYGLMNVGEFWVELFEMLFQ
jgi:CubicO group peptidase (beta-lactamase class C family)